MPRFPTREADVASLANRTVSGLREHAEDFPNPPHAADRLQASADAFEESYDAAVLAAVGAHSRSTLVCGGNREAIAGYAAARPVEQFDQVLVWIGWRSGG